MDRRIQTRRSAPQHGWLSLSNPTGAPVVEQQQQQQQQQPLVSKVDLGDEGRGLEEPPKWWSIKDRGVHFWKAGV